MVLTIQIDKLASGTYRAAALSGGIEVAEPQLYGSIEDAIRGEARAVPAGFAYFADVVYAGVSSGTTSLESLGERAALVADQLVATLAQMHEIAGR